MHERCATNMHKCQCVKFLCILSGCPAGAGKWHISYFSMRLHRKKRLQSNWRRFFAKYRYFKWVSAAVRMFRMSMARVMGPTPPGTGVM